MGIIHDLVSSVSQTASGNNRPPYGSPYGNASYGNTYYQGPPSQPYNNGIYVSPLDARQQLKDERRFLKKERKALKHAAKANRLVGGRYMAGPSQYMPNQGQFVPNQPQYIPSQGQYGPSQGQHAPYQDQYGYRPSPYATREDPFSARAIPNQQSVGIVNSGPASRSTSPGSSAREEDWNQPPPYEPGDYNGKQQRRTDEPK